MPSSWKRVDYLLHRWIGVALGLLMLSWFVSGIALMYYPYPTPTESRRLSLLGPLAIHEPIVGFRAAFLAAGDPEAGETQSDGNPAQAEPSVGAHGAERVHPMAPAPLVRGRLRMLGGKLVYQFWRERGGRLEPAAIVDATTGTVVTPIDSAMAVGVARDLVGSRPALRRVELMAQGDHYMMGNAFATQFPAYRVRFDDAKGTAVYVGYGGGDILGVVTNLTRWTTWIGTVPHWLYFQWLYTRPDLWTWTNLILPGIAALIAVTGIVLGTYQLFPRRRRGEWRVSAYRGVSKWHHITGVVFGILVLTWTFSGLLEILGPSNEPRPGQAGRVRGGPINWRAIQVSEAEAMKLADTGRLAMMPVAVDLVAVDGGVGYEVRFQDRRSAWVDASSGAVRGNMTGDDARRLAILALGQPARVRRVDWISAYDAYYYARHGREMHLPAWRVAFDDHAQSVVYLDPVSANPVGFVDADTRAWRWLRDGLHSIDVPALNNRRPLWDAVVLPLMIGGTVSAVTGVWLLVRRLRRIAEQRV
jgi:PepSY-associated TM region